MTTAVKLSTPQIQALHEIYAKTIKANITAKPNTIESLWKKGLIFFDKYIQDPAIFLTEEGKRAIGMADEPEDVVEEIQDELNTNMWDSPVISQDERETFSQMVENEFDRFDSKWNAEFVKAAGFGETLKWSNTSVWDGLTAEEIRKDLDTVYVDNRASRRALKRIQNNVSRRNWFKMAKQSRKQAKICGGKA